MKVELEMVEVVVYIYGDRGKCDGYGGRGGDGGGRKGSRSSCGGGRGRKVCDGMMREK